MDKFYTCEEIATRYRVTLRTVYDWIKRGDLTAIKIGKSFRISERSVQLFERQGKN